MNKDKIKLLLAFILMLTLICITGMSCNPVKRVLKNDKKFNIVAKEVIKRGYCVNDTVIVDTIIHDTVLSEKVVRDTFKLEKLRNIDTVLNNGLKLSIKDGVIIAQCPPVKIKTIYQTTTKYIKDLSYEKILKDSVLYLDRQLFDKKSFIKDQQSIIQENKIKTKLWQTRFWSLFVLITVGLGVYTYIKFRF